jgi:hypothetical protein
MDIMNRRYDQEFLKMEHLGKLLTQKIFGGLVGAGNPVLRTIKAFPYN